jgi:hypothetical protein
MIPYDHNRANTLRDISKLATQARASANRALGAAAALSLAPEFFKLIHITFLDAQEASNLAYEAYHAFLHKESDRVIRQASNLANKGPPFQAS